MFEITIPDMTCGGCASGVTRAIKGVDPHAKVDVDLPRQRVRVESAKDRRALVDALTQAGFQPSEDRD